MIKMMVGGLESKGTCCVKLRHMYEYLQFLIHVSEIMNEQGNDLIHSNGNRYLKVSSIN